MMFRKLTTLLTAVVVIFAMLPALAASAAPAASASLIEGASVYPGSNTYVARVTNNESGFLGLTGARANYLEIVMPPNVSQAACGAATVGTFTCRTRNGAVILEGGSLGPGDSLDIPFTGVASRPVNADRTTQFDVRVSDDGGVTTGSAGKLDAVVRALQLLTETLGAVAPAGVTDETGTVGQAITYGFSIKNHAQQAITVVPTLTSDGNETVGSAAAQSVTAGGTGAFTVPVTLGQVSGSSQQRTFTAGGTKQGDDTTSAGTATGPFTVEAPALLSLQASTFKPTAVRSDGTTYNFSLDGNKANLPGVNGLTGTLTFAGNTISLGAPTSLPRGGASGITFEYAPSTVVGADDVYDAVFTFSGTDDNGFAFTQNVSLADLITIDNIAPDINLDLAIPSDQQQVKNGDELEVEVTVQDGVIDYVEVQATVENASGAPTTTTFPVEGCEAGQTSCTGTVTIDGLGDYGSVIAIGQASDAADNFGTDLSDTYDIDNVLPTLVNPARIVEGGEYGATRPVVEVTVDDRYTVAGGCAAQNWDVDQTSNDPIFVQDVRYSNGESCSGGTNPGDNIRILVVNQTLDPDALYNVLYFQDRVGLGATADPLDDGALNSATNAIVQTVSGIAPAIPDLAEILRNGGEESAVNSDDAWWTRFGGNDPRAVIRNTRAGYMVRVLDGNGNVISTTPVDGPNAQVIVPIGSSEGSYTRSLELVNASGLISDPFTFAIALDQTAPAIADVTSSGTGDGATVTATFNEILWAGTNRSIDWMALESNTNPGEAPYYQYRPDAVEGGSGTTRTLTVDLPGNGDFAGAQYSFDSESPSEGFRYEDRAGNLLGDFLAG